MLSFYPAPCKFRAKIVFLPEASGTLVAGTCQGRQETAAGLWHLGNRIWYIMYTIKHMGVPETFYQ